MNSIVCKTFLALECILSRSNLDVAVVAASSLCITNRYSLAVIVSADFDKADFWWGRGAISRPLVLGVTVHRFILHLLLNTEYE
jgi:hypothetical protein